MAVYLLDHPPTRDQYRSPRRARPTGLTVVHTAESVMDTVGPDNGAENVAGFIQRRTTAGSYHDLADSDSVIQLVRYGDEAYQDGTGSNPYALSISFALAAADWPRLSRERRAAFLTQGARAFARQQAWLKANGYPTTPLRRVTRAQSDAGQAGFISHAERDPARRTDPGPGFPWEEFFTACRAGATAVAGSRIPDLDAPAPTAGTPAPLEDDMVRVMNFGDGHMWLVDIGAKTKWRIPGPGQLDWLEALGVPAVHGVQGGGVGSLFKEIS